MPSSSYIHKQEEQTVTFKQFETQTQTLRDFTEWTHQLFKVDQVVMESLISLVDKGDI